MFDGVMFYDGIKLSLKSSVQTVGPRNFRIRLWILS